MDDDAFVLFVRLHGPELVRLAYGLCGDRQRAEDAAQQAFEKVYVRRASLDEPLFYARRVVINAVRDTWRRFGRRETLGHDVRYDRAAGQDVADVGEREALLAQLRALPVKQRSVVLLRHWLDLSEAETARLLGISVGTVKSHNSRALAALRISYDQERQT